METKRPSTTLIALVWTLAAVAALRAQAHPSSAPAPSSSPSAASLRQLNGALETLARRVSPSIVQLVVTALGPGDMPERTGVLERQRLVGSGVIVDAAGYIVTNAHVVNGAERVRAAFTLPPGEEAGSRVLSGPVLDAHLVGVDKETDLAVLKVDTTGLPVLPLGDSDHLHKGELVFAFGSPAGLTNSMTMGMVSSVAREVNPRQPIVYIQTDAPINPGNSGGALVDADGSLVGINTFILSESGGSEGLGFAIPSGVVQLVYKQLRAYGHVHRGLIGIRSEEVTPVLTAGLGLSQNWGQLVSDVAPGGPAAAAGLQVGDVIVGLNGKPAVSLAEFVTDLTLRNLGRTVRLDVLRGRTRITLEIPVVERPDSLDRLVAMLDPEKNLIGPLGILGVALDPTNGIVVPGLRIPSGVLVLARALYAGSVESGLEQGDVIHAVNRAPVTSLEDLRTALRALKAGDACVLRIERSGIFMFLPFELD
jgi:serine protease Do